MNRASSHQVLVSTTPNLQGWQITQYHGTVSAHIVAGTNIFSDIAASWRDVFGGQSKSYKKQLEQINEKVVSELREKASQRGANALIGLQIDHDQISGQSKEMFMVTASATAVRAERRSKSGSRDNVGGENEPIAASEMSVEETIVRFRREHQNGSFQFNEANWRFLIENQVDDFAKVVQRTVTNILEKRGRAPGDQDHLNRGQDYFLSISREVAKPHLYDMATSDDGDVREWSIDVLEEGNLLDFGQVRSMLEGDFFSHQKPALRILTRVDKPYYDQSDADHLRSLKSKIEGGFGKRGEVLEVETSSTFSSGTKEVWQIKEGAHNSMRTEYCSETGMDIYGFRKDETRPEEAAVALEMKIEALNRRFDND